MNALALVSNRTRDRKYSLSLIKTFHQLVLFRLRSLTENRRLSLLQIRDTAVFMGLVQAQPLSAAAAASASEESAGNSHQSSGSDVSTDLTANQFPAESVNES